MPSSTQNYADATAQMAPTTAMAAPEEESACTTTPSCAGTPYKSYTAPLTTASLPTSEVPTEDTRKDPRRRRPLMTEATTFLTIDPRIPPPTLTDDTRKEKGTPTTEDIKRSPLMNKKSQEEDQELSHSMKRNKLNHPPAHHPLRRQLL